MSDWWAVSGDMVRSRHRRDRAALLPAIDEALHSLRRSMRDEFVAPPVLTKGVDEMSMVFRRPDRILEFALAFNAAIWPVAFRFGVGVGEIDVGLESRRAERMDGPAFHAAARALERAKADGSLVILEGPRLAGPALDLFHGAGSACSALMAAWTPAIVAAFQAYEELGNQTAVAVRLGTSQQAVSAALRRGHHALIVELRTACTSWLRSLS